MLLTKKWSRKC